MAGDYPVGLVRVVDASLGPPPVALRPPWAARLQGTMVADVRFLSCVLVRGATGWICKSDAYAPHEDEFLIEAQFQLVDRCAQMHGKVLPL